MSSDGGVGLVTLGANDNDKVFQHLSAESTKTEPLLRSTQVLKQEAEEAWRATQKIQAQANLEFVKIPAETEEKEKKRADEIRMAEIKAEADAKRLQAEREMRADEILMAKLDADK